MTVDGLEAVCGSLECGYQYANPTPKITGFTLSGSTLSITGAGFVNSLRSISFSNIPCTNAKIISTSLITCSVTPVAGSWVPVVADT